MAALRVPARSVQVAISVVGIRQDVIVVHALELALAVTLIRSVRRLHQLSEAAFTEPLHIKALLADNLLSNKRVQLLALEDVEVVIETLDRHNFLELLKFAHFA